MRENPVWLIDLDGVIWCGTQALEGSAWAVAKLREHNRRVLFATNNSAFGVHDILEKLEKMGIEADVGDLATSAQAAALLLEPGQTVLACSGRGLKEILADRGVKVYTPDDDAAILPERNVDAVVVGWHKDFNFKSLTLATRCVLKGSRLIGTNEDATYPSTDGILPGGGALVAAVAYASATQAIIAGKPHDPFINLLRQCGVVGESAVEMVVGDRVSTDGILAKKLNADFSLVLSGVTSSEDVSRSIHSQERALDTADSLAQVVSRIL
ncbi:MAG: HAD-IIA family hydrolase [Actinobacteria bacterium]|nr:HAD-IIA family hydrolase [Actinomycetota bacterium]